MPSPQSGSGRATTEIVAAVLAGWEAPSATAPLDAIAVSPTYRTEDGRDLPRIEHLNVRYGRLLHLLVKEFQPARLLEIGMATGISSAYLALARQGYGGAHHAIVDPFQSADWGGGGRALLASLGLMHGVEVFEDPPLMHWVRERTGRRRRLAVYQKVSEDVRGASSY